jgi:hypothetical protein
MEGVGAKHFHICKLALYLDLAENASPLPCIIFFPCLISGYKDFKGVRDYAEKKTW